MLRRLPNRQVQDIEHRRVARLLHELDVVFAQHHRRELVEVAVAARRAVAARTVNLQHRADVRKACAERAASESDDELAKSEAASVVLDRTTKMQLGILLFSNFIVQLGVGMIIVILPLFADSIGLGAAGVGLLIALPQLTKLLMNLPIGHLVDVVGRKPALVVGSILDALGQFATGGSSSIAQLVSH